MIMASSTQINITKEKQTLQNFTTPKQTNSEKDCTLDSPALTIDFDDFTSSSSIMEFLKQEQKCDASASFSSGNESEIDTESIFQEVSRLADNSDTRSVDELLREAELLLQHHNFNENFAQNRKMTASKSSQSQSTIQMNSKYTKSIKNVNPCNTVTKLINGYIAPVKLKSANNMAYTPETPTPTNPLSNGSSNTFNAFVDNLPSESVISQESVPLDLQANTIGSAKSSSSSNNTTGKDITTKQMDGDDTDDDGTDTTPIKTVKRKKISESFERNQLLRKATQHMESLNENKKRDEADIYGEGWACSYRKLTNSQKIFAKTACDEIFILGQLGKLNLNTVRTETTSYPSPLSVRSSSCSSLPQIISVHDVSNGQSTPLFINSPSPQTYHGEEIIVPQESQYSSFTELFTDNSFS